MKYPVRRPLHDLLGIPYVMDEGDGLCRCGQPGFRNEKATDNPIECMKHWTSVITIRGEEIRK